jgi:hypothetical protein
VWYIFCVVIKQPVALEPMTSHVPDITWQSYGELWQCNERRQEVKSRGGSPMILKELKMLEQSNYSYAMPMKISDVPRSTEGFNQH